MKPIYEDLEQQIVVLERQLFACKDELQSLKKPDVQSCPGTISPDRAEETLRLSEERLRLAMEATQQGWFDLNVQTGEVTVSPEYPKIIGYQPTEFNTNLQSWIDNIHPEDREGILKAYRECLGSGNTGTMEYRRRTRTGDWKWIRSIGRIVEFDAAQRPLRMTGTHADITERKETEAELRYLRNYLSNIINSMPSMLVGVDAEGKVTLWNRQAELESGLHEGEAVGHRLDEVYPPLGAKMDRIHAAMGERRVLTDSSSSRLPGGETRYNDITIYPLVAEDIAGAVIRVDDVTERVRMEEMMVQSEKMLSVGGLAAGLAHEINNPVGAMLQASQLIGQRVSPELQANLRVAQECGTSLSAVRKYLEQREVFVLLEDLRQSGQRAAEIVTNMLSFSRKPEGGGGSEDLAELLDSSLALAASEYDLKKHYDFRQIEIRREYQADVPAVVCQANRIQQVILNILRNGAEAMHEEERLRESDPTQDDGWRPRFTLRLAAETQAGMVRIEIADNGPGMDEATRRRIFEPFFTTKAPGVGTGLGLSVSYFIIRENHGGEIGVESAPGQGAKFIIRLPVMRRQP